MPLINDTAVVAPPTLRLDGLACSVARSSAFLQPVRSMKIASLVCQLSGSNVETKPPVRSRLKTTWVDDAAIRGLPEMASDMFQPTPIWYAPPSRQPT